MLAYWKWVYSRRNCSFSFVICGLTGRRERWFKHYYQLETGGEDVNLDLCCLGSTVWVAGSLRARDCISSRARYGVDGLFCEKGEREREREKDRDGVCILAGSR